MKKIIIMAIDSKYTDLIFNEIITHEYRGKPINKERLNKKIYIYSSREEQAIRGYIKISNVNKISKLQLMKSPDYEIVKERYDKNNDFYYAMDLYDVTEFEEYLDLKCLRMFMPDINLKNYCTVIREDNPLYEIITEWDKAYSLDGNFNKDDTKVKKLIKRRHDELNK